MGSTGRPAGASPVRLTVVLRVMLYAFVMILNKFDLEIFEHSIYNIHLNVEGKDITDDSQTLKLQGLNIFRISVSLFTQHIA
jgi:hypothetical protein